MTASADPDPTDPELIAMALDGNRAAFGELYRRYAPMVHGILLARVGPTEADDGTQDVFTTALTRLAQLRDRDAFGGWLAVIARNRALDAHRRAGWTAPLPEDLAAAPDPPRPEAVEALAAIQSLPAAYRETLVLRLVEGMTGPQIAAKVGLTPGSVRVNLHRGMKLLRQRLSEPRPGEATTAFGIDEGATVALPTEPSS